MRILPPAVATAVHVATLARKAGLPIPPKVLAVLDAAANPFPGRWLLDPLPGDPIRVVELCAGPGGWSEGLETILGADVDIFGLDVSKDACATASAAGHHRACVDITTVDPEHHPALAHTVGVIISPPCPSFSRGGKLTGLQAGNVMVVADAIGQIGGAGGFIAADIDHDDNNFGECDCAPDTGCFDEGFIPRDGRTWQDIRALAADVTDPRIALMLEVALWPLALYAGGAPIRWVAMEQSDNVPNEIMDALGAEFMAADWVSAQYDRLEAADYGLPSRRNRTYMIAARDMLVPVCAPRAAETTMADALRWASGERVNTRGNRPVDPATGRAKGGNTFSADGPSWCLTGKARTWYRESDGLRFTTQEAGLLVGFRPSYPWQGSRTSAFQQAADVVSPIMAAGILAPLMSKRNRYADGHAAVQARISDYLVQLYRLDDYLDAENFDAEDFDTVA
jgi:DNA (cytosine-5)-methyltransferase 1